MGNLRMEGRVALVTGGGTGMGQATAKLLAREGAKVVVAGRREKPLAETVQAIEAQGGQAAFVTVDVSKWFMCKAMADFTIKRFGWVDTLVAAAGEIWLLEKVEETTEEQWNRIIDIDLKGVYAAIKYTLPSMIERKRGSIVAVSSTIAGVTAPGYASYSAAKGGVSALIRTIAVQYAEHGIRANAVCPGMVVTPMAWVDRTQPFEPEAYVKKLGYPIKRPCLPEDVANAILFLASDEAGYITGQNLFVDGGMSIV